MKVTQLIKTFTIFHGNQKLISVFRRAS